MKQLSISEIINKTGDMSTKKNKVEWLKKNNTLALKNILVLTYDKSKKFLVPDSEPPYNPSVSEDNHGALYKQVRKLTYVVDGFSDPSIQKSKRESVFIEILETVHRDDAKVLIQMIQKKPFKGITKNIVNESFGLDIK